MTLKLSVVAWLLAVALGILSGALRTVAFRPLRVLATFYVEFFRNVPLLVWMFFWYFAVPPALPDAPREWLNDHSLEFWAAVVALGVYSGARFSGVLRSGIEALTAGTLIYLVLCVSLASLMSWIERRTAIPGLITSGGRRRR